MPKGEKSPPKGRYGPNHGPEERFTVDVEVFRRHVKFRLNVPPEEVEAEVADYDPEILSIEDADDGATCSVDTPNGEIVSYVWVRRYVNDLESLENLAHECLHAATGILTDIGAQYGGNKDDRMYGASGNDEVLAWLFSYIFFEALKRTRLSE